ncbi:class I adenylate-forming enzyme family protein [Arcanobacterium ihumii]|uniref:class I adenylate-forming enzyme family protein n=1 Tax=Arcanobacterium ihumii TaxID=2138162 RepID=UPI00135A5CBB|nr:AMP-binding protein [Arcanobacterium ihumii]
MRELAFYNPAHSLDRAAKAHPNRESLLYGDHTFTVKQSAFYTRQLAQFLIELGVSEGERVCLIARNSPYHMLLHVACARIGAVFVPISYRLSRLEVAELLDISTPAVIVTDPEVATEGRFEGSNARHVVIDDDAQSCIDTLTLDETIVGEFGYRKVTEASNFDGAFITDGVNDECETARNSIHYFEGLGAILFTSGSTGKPKPVGLTHENLWWGSRNFREGFEYSNLDVEMVVAPLTHIGGFNGTTLDLFSHGGTVVVVREFDPTEVLYRLEKHRVAIMFGVPTIYAALMNHPNFASTDLSAFRLPLIGGAVSSPALLLRMMKNGLPALNVWGMTETSASGCCLTADNLKLAPGAIGRPFSHVEARIVDPETGTDCPAGVAGEMILRGPNVITEYWQDSASTEAGIKTGWLHTGDLVSVDSEGFFWVKGRLHNLINTGGEKVSPEEVMAVIGRHPAVSDCAVVGIPDSVWGEAVAVAVIVKQGRTLPSLEELNDFAAESLARYKLPKHLMEVDAFPLTANGKVDRAKIQNLFGA